MTSSNDDRGDRKFDDPKFVKEVKQGLTLAPIFHGPTE